MAAGATAVMILVSAAVVRASSPVDKVVEMLEECKAKVAKDLAAEAKAMEEYNAFCEEEANDKAFAIETAARDLLDLGATIEDSKATISELEDEITQTGQVISEKDGEAAAAKIARDTAQAAFAASEKEMVTSVAELERAVGVFKNMGGASLLQSDTNKVKAMIASLSAVVQANALNVESKEKLKSFLQEARRATQQATEDDDAASFLQERSTRASKRDEEDDDDDDGDDDLDLAKAMSAPGEKVALAQQSQAPKAAAFESQTGGIIATIEDMFDKAQDTLKDIRKKETEDQMAYELLANGKQNEIGHEKEKLAEATSNKAATTQELEDANGKLIDTQKSKAADEQYLATLKTECQAKASEWEERQRSAKEEMGAIDKAKEILVSGVKALVQISSTTRVARWGDEVEPATDGVRKALGARLRALARKYHSFALNQLASRSRSDPFVKIRGLIEEMIAKLMKEAEEEATKEAFCQEEMGKAKASKEDKEGKAEKFKTRIDTAETSIAELSVAIKDLTSEIGVIDKAQSEATAIRQTENADYKKASEDFKLSADAVARAIEVLKSYYEGAFVQVSAHRATMTLAARRSKQPAFGSSKGDTAHTIISILEMSQEDFTTLLAETEAEEQEAVKAFTKLTNENKISKATKEMEIKTKESEVKSLKVQLENSKEDHAGVKEELDAVLAYIDKLKPECETKAMSYEEKKAAREAEVEGLKDALGILEGSASLLQTGRRLRSFRRA